MAFVQPKNCIYEKLILLTHFMSIWTGECGFKFGSFETKAFSFNGPRNQRGSIFSKSTSSRLQRRIRHNARNMITFWDIRILKFRELPNR